MEHNSFTEQSMSIQWSVFFQIINGIVSILSLDMIPYTVERFIDQFVFSDTRSIMQNNPYQAFALISIGIEIIGRCFCRGNWDVSGSSEDCFYVAIHKCPELSKYKHYDIEIATSSKCIFRKRKKKTNELYSLLRCGMAHSLKPNAKLVLVPDKNDFSTNTIGCNELYDDCLQAWNAIKLGKTTIKKKLDELIFYVDDVVSGSTINNVTNQHK